jgi:hypothetical protein
MAKAAKWQQFSTKVILNNNPFNHSHKKFRHLGTPESVQVEAEFDVPAAYEEPIEDYITKIRWYSNGLLDATITHSSYVQQEDGYDAYSEAETTISGWRAELTDSEKKAVEMYFERSSSVEKAMTEYFGTNPLG